MSGYVLARAAEQDLDSLWSYVAEESVDAADRLVAGIFESFEALARNPGMGHKRENLTFSPSVSGRLATTSSFIALADPRSKLLR